MEVGQLELDLGDLGLGQEDCLADRPDRGLDRRAVVLGEDVEEGGADPVERGVEVNLGRSVAPGCADLAGHQPIIGLGQGRELVPGEAGE